MNKKLIIAGIVGVVLFLTFILLLVLSVGGKNESNKKSIVTDKATTPPPITQQQQPLNQTNATATATELKTTKQQEIKINEIAKEETKIKKNIKHIKNTNKIQDSDSSEQKIVCENNLNYLICSNNICEINGVICGKVKEITINSIVYEQTQ